ncbi:MAG: translation initiation factor [candidate division KSB1 bacterium]|nr:translation initiation factor [candidate division KSB1 bacterium]
MVYSTGQGKTCPNCEQPVDECVCKSQTKNAGSGAPVIKIRRETKGRAGKTVTTIFGIVPNQQKDIATQLKQQCGTGGSAKDGVIIIQGDHRTKIKAFLEKKGYTVKLAGG